LVESIQTNCPGMGSEHTWVFFAFAVRAYYLVIIHQTESFSSAYPSTRWSYSCFEQPALHLRVRCAFRDLSEQNLFLFPPLRIQTKRLGEGQSNKGTPKIIYLLKYPSFSMTIVGYHAKVVTLFRPRKWPCLLVELCDLSRKHHSLKSLCIINSQNV